MFDLAAHAAGLGVKEPERFAARCEALRRLLERENGKTNLTRITEPAAFAVKHVADSLGIAGFFPEFAAAPLRVADIGCGAGFPSLVLALAFPQLRITAIDSRHKKTAFVQLAARELELDNLAVVTGRSRELNGQAACRRRFDVVTARAVAELATVCADSRDFLAPGGRFILYKTPEQLETELPAAVKLGGKLGLVFAVSPAFELPEQAGRRQFVTAAAK